MLNHIFIKFLATWLVLSPLSVQGQASSENNAKLKVALERFPRADLNGDGVLSWSELKYSREQAESPNPYSVSPTHAEIAYGSFERNQLDLWLADVQAPAPIIIYIHGGGFVGGSKEKAARVTFIDQALQDGVHFASINYRYKYRSEADIDDPQRTGMPGCFLDGARAVQFLRANAEQWNIDPDRLIVFGSSAGGGISLFLGANDDLADPKSEDPVLHESSRVFAVGHFSSQPTYKVAQWPEILGMPEVELKEIMRPEKLNIPEYVNLGLTKEAEVESPLGLRYRSMIDMAANIDSMDPPMFIFNGNGIDPPKTHAQAVHHVKLSMYLEDQLKTHHVSSDRLFPKIDGVGRVDPYVTFYHWCLGLLME